MSILCILYLAALISTIFSASTGKVPLWVPVLFVCIGLLIQCLPLR